MRERIKNRVVLIVRRVIDLAAAVVRLVRREPVIVATLASVWTVYEATGEFNWQELLVVALGVAARQLVTPTVSQPPAQPELPLEH